MSLLYKSVNHFGIVCFEGMGGKGKERKGNEEAKFFMFELVFEEGKEMIGRKMER